MALIDLYLCLLFLTGVHMYKKGLQKSLHTAVIQGWPVQRQLFPFYLLH